MKRLVVASGALAVLSAFALAAVHRRPNPTRIATKQWTFSIGTNVEVRVDQDAVYWTTHSINVARMAKRPATALRYLGNNQSPTEWLALDEQFIYWNAAGTIMRSSKTGGSASEVVHYDGVCEGIAVNSSDVFWAEHYVGRRTSPLAGATEKLPWEDGCKSCPSTHGAIMKVAKQGGAPIVVSRAHRPGTIAADETSVFWADGTPGVIAKAPASGGAAVVLAAKQHDPFGLALDETTVYWSDRWGRNEWPNLGPASGAILAVDKNGGAPRIIADHRTNPNRLTVDDTYVYWADEGTVSESSDPEIPKEKLPIRNGLILRAPKKGGPPVVLATRQNGPTSVAVDDSYVYWTNIREGAIFRVDKAPTD